MVGSFRTTFTGWIDQRLAAEVYVRANSQKHAGELVSYLKDRVDAILPVTHLETRLGQSTGDLYGHVDHATYRDNWPLLSKAPEAWNKFAAGEGVLINEQLARNLNIVPGQAIDIAGKQRLPVLGVYSDYGNPRGQAIIVYERLVDWFETVPRLRFALRVAPEKADQLVRDIQEKFSMGRENVINQTDLKAGSRKIFERTFSVTDALNVLTLTIAAFAIFTSLVTLAAMRLPQLAPVWAMGITRWELARLEILRAVLLAIFTIILALPVGLVFAWLLLNVVNTRAFGWQLPMEIFPWDWVRLAGLAVLAAAAASIIPARRLAKLAPADLIKEFSNAR